MDSKLHRYRKERFIEVNHKLLCQMNTEIRPYTPSDKESCLQAFKTNVPDFFTAKEADDYRQWLTEKALLPHNHYYVLLMDQEIEACGGFGFDPNHYEVRFIWGLVDRSFHRMGLGKQLTHFRIAEIKKLYPGIPIRLDTTQFSFEFFKKLDFRIDKITKDFYAPGYDRYDMTLFR